MFESKIRLNIKKFIFLPHVFPIVINVNAKTRIIYSFLRYEIKSRKDCEIY